MNMAKNFHTCVNLCKIPSNLKGKSKSSQEWLTRQLNDPYVKKAHEMNYRARSAFKLIEMDDKLKILRPGTTVVECGAAPGAWTQVIVQRINSDGKETNKPIGKIVGVDLLPIAPVHGAFLLSFSDFTHREIQEKIKAMLKETNCEENAEVRETNESPLIDVILSDMAPNATGHNGTDHYRILNLAQIALKFAVENGKTGSHFLTKLWNGSETKSFEKQLFSLYRDVKALKPPCSRDDSSELFIFAKSKK